MNSKYKETHSDFGKFDALHCKTRERMNLIESGRDIPIEFPSFVRRATPLSCLTLIRLSKCPSVLTTFPLSGVNRYLVPNDLSAYHFNYIIRKRIKLAEKDSLYFFVNGKYLLKGGKYSNSDV